MPDEEVSIVEVKEVGEEPVIITGLPDVGLVGLIAASYFASKMRMEDVGFLESDLLPPVVVLYDGMPKSPVRILKSGGLVAIISEIAIPAVAISKVSRTIVKWASKKKAKLIITLGGIAVEERYKLEKPTVYATASSKEAVEELKSKGMGILDRGYLAGPYALIMRWAPLHGLITIGLLAQSFFNYPDPEAAASVLEELGKLIGLEIDVTELKEKGEEIRLAARDLMRRTEGELTRMRKNQEYDVPPLHV
ncbi:proteasome assembly chaperone family protein [Candidatus Bathyarchaeota archaeon]|nr:proteasome assembly chaperone family protein [Candidatus Bathyarchaeota archaeon]MBS7613058.1 proteasome assembly chaperone family protein [Candidatus Bathyarchaeota archaeon]MBS7617295.1 proteasome assembly chaperone family protein [Candidatus Bathyarchaeota archaeon]